MMYIGVCTPYIYTRIDIVRYLRKDRVARLQMMHFRLPILASEPPFI